MSGASIEQAAMAIASGMCHTVALVYGNNGKTAGDRYGGATDRYGSGGAGQWFPYGMTSPGAVHAMMFNRHAHEYGTTAEQLAHVAVTFRDHAALNPGAVMRDRVTVEQVLASRFVCEPLHLFDYCLINDGGVALILTAADRARDMARPPVYVRGFAMATALKGSSMPPEDYWRAPMQAAARDLTAMTGLTPPNMDAFMIYDNFSPTVLFSLEGFGICPVGESGPFVAEGRLALGGSHPTNSSGGHMSESYMQGWALNVEAVRQIRGDCGARQLKDCNLVQYVCAAPMVSGIVYGKDPA
jgi:acetyl-CoA acetyltransferase